MASRRAKADKLWRIWYALLVLAVHAFLLYASFRRYASFRSRALREQWPMGPMNFHLAASITAALLLPLFLYAAFLRTGNYAEDGIQIGRDRDSLRAVSVAAGAGGPAGSGHPGRVCVGRLRRHFMPYTCALHLLMALCLLVPLPVLEAAEILHGQMGKDSVWRTNLDFILSPTASATNIVSTEIFNLVLALAILIVRYPSVFWYTNRAFSLLYSVILCLCGLHSVLAYEATSVLYKAASTDSVAAAVNLAPAAVLALHVVGDLLMVLANVSFFEFGYAQVLGSLRRHRHYLQLEAPSSGCSDRSNGSSSCGSDEAPCWLSYAPHLVGILLMVLAVLCKVPVLWDWVCLYRTHQQPIMLAAVISGCVYLFLWIAIWLLLGCRSSWQFNIHPEIELPGKQLAPGYSQGRTQAATTSECRRSPPSSADSDLSKKSNQYVYLQQQHRLAEGHVAMIPTVSEQVDNASENSYTCGGGGGGTLDRQAGLVKYQVRRNSAQMMGANGSLKRSAALLARTKSGNRVTFKERHETIPGSPGSSQNTSSDSGIEASRIHGQAALQISLHDDYARVNKQPRPPSRQSSNYDDYPMLGCLFGQTDGAAVAAAAAAEYYQTDPYGRPLPGVPVLPPPPAGYGASAAAAAAAAAAAGDYASDPYGGYSAEATATADYKDHGVPDILLSRSPFASLGRPTSKPGAAASAADYYEMQHQQMQHQLQQQQQHIQQQLHARSGSYASLPQQQQPVGDQVEGLCSQV